jgi:uncharacterized membrane protein
MAFCASCGAPVEGKFCAKCGAAAQASPEAGPPPGGYAAGSPPAAESAGMTDNVASLLCYLGSFITGILFLVLEPYNKNRVIRFHAFQSIFLGVAWVATWFVLVIFSIMLAIAHLGALISLLHLLLWLAFVGLTVYLMIMAYQNKQVELPVIGPLARKQAGV